jgi:hypothetical protein
MQTLHYKITHHNTEVCILMLLVHYKITQCSMEVCIIMSTIRYKITPCSKVEYNIILANTQTILI